MKNQFYGTNIYHFIRNFRWLQKAYCKNDYQNTAKP